MPNIWKLLSGQKAEPYQFPEAETLEVEEPMPTSQPVLEEEAEPLPELEEPDVGATPLQYAQIQADKMLRAAKRQAEELLEQAREEARKEADALCEKAREEGWTAGHTDGFAQGTAQALEESRKTQEEKLRALSAEVGRFLEQANETLDEQMTQNIDELKDLAIAVAEKVIAVSLRSSSEVVGRMIQAAVDRRKRREWVRIYVAECYGQTMKLSPQLSAALSALSDQVRIIPMADDEPGTCIIEMPDEIVDASAATQLNNIRTMLSDIPAGDERGRFDLRGGAFDHVPTHDSPGL